MAKFISRITAVSLDGSDRDTIYRDKKKNRKVSRWLRPLERRTRRANRALQVFGEEIASRHNRSNRKRRNGWLREGNLNLMKASRKAGKKLFNI
jgi:hypothetical protein